MKRYLGDSVYGEMTERGLILTTENGVRVTNQIVLDTAVCIAMITFFFPKLAEAARTIEK